MYQKHTFKSFCCKHFDFKALGPIPKVLEIGLWWAQFPVRISDLFWYWKCPNMSNQRSRQTFFDQMSCQTFFDARSNFFFDIRNRVSWKLGYGCHLFLLDIRNRVSWKLGYGCHLNCDTAIKSEQFCWQILITATSLTEIPGNPATDVSSITVPSLTENPGSLVMDANKSIYLG